MAANIKIYRIDLMKITMRSKSRYIKIEVFYLAIFTMVISLLVNDNNIIANKDFNV